MPRRFSLDSFLRFVLLISPTNCLSSPSSSNSSFGFRRNLDRLQNGHQLDLDRYFDYFDCTLAAMTASMFRKDLVRRARTLRQFKIREVYGGRMRGRLTWTVEEGYCIEPDYEITLPMIEDAFTLQSGPWMTDLGKHFRVGDGLDIVMDAGATILECLNYKEKYEGRGGINSQGGHRSGVGYIVGRREDPGRAGEYGYLVWAQDEPVGGGALVFVEPRAICQWDLVAGVDQSLIKTPSVNVIMIEPSGERNPSYSYVQYMARSMMFENDEATMRTTFPYQFRTGYMKYQLPDDRGGIMFIDENIEFEYEDVRLGIQVDPNRPVAKYGDSIYCPWWSFSLGDGIVLPEGWKALCILGAAYSIRLIKAPNESLAYGCKWIALRCGCERARGEELPKPRPTNIHHDWKVAKLVTNYERYLDRYSLEGTSWDCEKAIKEIKEELIKLHEESRLREEQPQAASASASVRPPATSRMQVKAREFYDWFEEQKRSVGDLFKKSSKTGGSSHSAAGTSSAGTETDVNQTFFDEMKRFFGVVPMLLGHEQITTEFFSRFHLFGKMLFPESVEEDDEKEWSKVETRQRIMVQHRNSLDALVLQAWRDRWTEIEWSVALKAALNECSSEVNKLCGLIIKQATLSEVPNKLMFNYLSFTIASQVVSHASFIQAVIEYKDFHKEQCIEAILDVLNFVRERLKCSTVDTYHCQRMCSLLTKLFQWLTTALEHSIQHVTQTLTGDLITTLMAFSYNPFISVCLYFDKLEDGENYSDLCDRVKALNENMSNGLDWLQDSFKHDFRGLTNRIDDSSQIFAGVHLNRFRDPVPQPTVISLSVLYGSVFLAEPLEAPIEVLKNVREVQQLPWFQVMRDFIRGSLLLQQECASSVPESHLTAFVYLRIPRVIHELFQSGVLAKDQLLEALRHVANFHSLFNSLDMKARCDCFYFFLTELHKLHLITETEMADLKEIRTRDKSPLTDSSPGNQANISLVLKAEPTLQTLLKSFHSEFAQKQEKLVQMMHHMISGKSFEFICAAAAATGRLSTFAGKLIDFNETSKRAPVPAEEKAEDAVLRAELFDLSFLLLSRIVQLYSCSPIRQNPNARGTFFESWCTRYVDIGRRSRHPSTMPPVSTPIITPVVEKPAAPAQAESEDAADTAVAPMETDEPKEEDAEPVAVVEKPSASIDQAQPLSSDQCAEIVQKLKSNQQGWISNASKEWNVICEQLPHLGQYLLQEIKNEQISQEELKTLFSGLVLINVNGVNWVCSLLLCLAQWLVGCPASDERKRLASSLHAFVDTSLVQGQERTKLTDRQMFMANVTKRLLAPLLASNPVPSPPYPWLNSVRRQVQSQQPLMTGLSSLPPLDTMRHYLSGALRQGWLGSSALSIIERCQRMGEHKLWIRIWFDELSKLSAADELNLWCDICMACCYVDPSVTLIHFVEMLAVFVLETGRELFCVAPRGASLSRFLVQLYLLGFRSAASRVAISSVSASTTVPAAAVEKDEASASDEPKQKLRKMESVQSDSTSANDGTTMRDNFTNALTNLYRRFCVICEDGDLRPAVFFVGSFLRCLAEYQSPEARRMMNELPPHLIALLIRTDPRILTAPIVLALTDLSNKTQRQRALQNLCLLRQLKAL